jgi:hypothetical protein
MNHIVAKLLSTFESLVDVLWGQSQFYFNEWAVSSDRDMVFCSGPGQDDHGMKKWAGICDRLSSVLEISTHLGSVNLEVSVRLSETGVD